MIPSRRVYQWLGLGTAAGLAIALLANARPALLGVSLGVMLTWDAIVLGLALLDSQRVRAHRVKISRQPIDRLSIGRDNPIGLAIESGKQSARLQICDDSPQAFTAAPALLEMSIAANHQQNLTYSVFPSQRGEYAWGNLQVRQLGAWGLAWHHWQIPQSCTVAVYPDLIGLKSLSLRLTLQSSGSIRRARQLGMGTEFAELREYSVGDDPRRIDWKATARRSRLLMRVLEPEQEQTLIILLDRGRLMTAQVQGLARFDWGLNAALALALAGLNLGDRVGVGVFDRTMHTWMPPQRGQSQLAQLIDRLTPIQPVLLEPDYINAITTVTRQQTRRALVVLLTDLVDKTASSELLLAMARLAPRYLPFCVTLRDPQIDRQSQPNSNETTATIPNTYARAVALDLLAQRHLALATLKQKGALILDAPANQISEQLVDRYLRLKARSQL